MRVCLLNYDGAPTTKATRDRQVGGLHTILYNLSTSLSQSQGVEVVVIYRQDSEEPELERRGKVLLVKIGAGGRRKLSRDQLDRFLPEFIAGTEKYLRDMKPDIIHTSGSEAALVMCELREYGFRAPWIHTNYATLAVRHILVKGIKPEEVFMLEIPRRERRCLERCDHVIALSQVDRQEICTVFGLSPSKITAIFPGVDTSVFTPGSTSIRQPIVMSAGRMAPIKDFPFLIRSFRLVSDLNPSMTNLQLVIIGGNRYERDKLGLYRLVSDLGLANRTVFFDGVSQSDLARQFQRARVAVGVSRHETFGLTPLEAMACGTPVVVRGNSGYLSTLTDGYGGLVAENNDEGDLARKISYALNLDEKGWQEMSSRAIESAEAFSWHETARRHLEVYGWFI